MNISISLHLVLVLSIISTTVHSQTTWQDDFSDSNITSNPTWGGNTNSFFVNGLLQLQLNAPAITSSKHLSVASQASLEANWDFTVQLDFNPSSNNYAKVYLMSSNASLNQSLNGYYLRIGGSSADRISLFRQDGFANTLIAESQDDLLDESKIEMGIRVVRDSSLNWIVAIDTTLNQNFVTIFSGADSQYVSSTFFGIECIYTSTRSDRFFFDDFSVNGTLFIDSIPPRLKRFSFPNTNQVSLTFSEHIDSSSATNPSNYTLFTSGEQPSLVTWRAQEPKVVILEYAANFTNRQQYLLEIKGLADNYGNTVLDSILTFEFFRPNYRDIVFNEIMYDPEPSVTLPEAEFLECFNASGKGLNIEDWKLVIGNDTQNLAPFSLGENDHVLIISSVHKPLFDSIPHLTIPSGNSWLKNSGDRLILLNEHNQVIDAIQYDDGFYQNNGKAGGGWSLEQIDPSLPCSERMNWCASNAATGGTPAKMNEPEIGLPSALNEVLGIFQLNPLELSIEFAQGLDLNQLPSISSSNLERVSFNPLSPTFLQLHLQTALSVSPTSFYILADSSSCLGALIGDTLQISEPELPEAGDVILNELLFNPSAGGADFIELWNTSNKTINLDELRLASINQLDQVLDVYSCGGDLQLLLPKSIVAISTDPSSVCEQYSCLKKRFFIETVIPSMPDDEGGIAITTKDQNILELVRYGSSWHHPLITNEEGVSLERISPLLPSNEALSWHSASSTVQYATPGRLNSQFNLPGVGQARFQISSKTLSPNNDGFNDIISIKYILPQSCQLTAKVYSIEGVVVQSLIDNKLMQPEGQFTWNGTSNNGELAPTGIYVLFFEWFTPRGQHGESKLSVALSR